MNKEIDIHTVNKNMISVEIYCSDEVSDILFCVSCEILKNHEEEKLKNKLLGNYRKLLAEEKKKR